MTFTVDVGGIVCDGVSDSKIDDFELTVDNDKVPRLQIRMDDLLFVGDTHGLQHLAYKPSINFCDDFQEGCQTCCQ